MKKSLFVSLAGMAFMLGVIHPHVVVAQTCTYSLNPTNQNFSASGGSGSLTVNAPVSCGWTATNTAAWVVITFGSSGSGTGTVTFMVATNVSGAARSDTLTVVDQIFTLTQDGVPCTYTVSPSNATFTARGGTGSLSVAAPPDCPWTAASNDGWITITGGTSGSGTGTVAYSVAPNYSLDSLRGSLAVAGETVFIAQTGARRTVCPVKLAGVLTYGDEQGNLTRVSVRKRDLLSTNLDRLVLELDLDFNTLRLIEIDQDNTEIAELAISTRCAFLPDNLFAGDLIFDSLIISNDAVSLVGDGALQVRGKYKVNAFSGAPTRISAKIMGVINDPINGTGAEVRPAMFKGIFSSEGRGFPANELE